MSDTIITFSLPLWRYSAGKGSWYFVTLPREDANFIKWIQDKTIVGFGFIRVEANIGTSTWETSIFPTKQGEYLLAIKSNIRKKECLTEGMIIQGTIRLI